MSSFQCLKCGTLILDSPFGYTTGCEHYPIEKIEFPKECEHCKICLPEICISCKRREK